MVLNQSNFFDLEDIWMNELIGDVWIAFFLGLVIIWIVAIKRNMPYEIPIILTVIWVGILLAYAQAAMFIVWIFVVLVVGVTFYYNVIQAIDRS